MVGFWTWYSRALALAVPSGAAWLFWKAASSPQIWWTDPASIALVTTLVGAIAPCTALVSSWAKIQLDAQRQHHELAQATARQQHEITTDYLNRALDPAVPIAMRYQLLRFLSTSARSGDKLETWAASELRRLDPIVQDLSKEVEKANERIMKAQTPSELNVAERQLSAVMARLGSEEKPRQPPVTVASIRAKLFGYKDVGALNFPSEDLTDAGLQGCKLRNSNFENATLVHFCLHQADARKSSFDAANLAHADLSEADMRGASFRGASLKEANLRGTRLEGADLTDATLPRQVKATYDSTTVWPKGFDASQAGAIKVDDDSPPI